MNQVGAIRSGHALRIVAAGALLALALGGCTSQGSEPREPASPLTSSSSPSSASASPSPSEGASPSVGAPPGMAPPGGHLTQGSATATPAPNNHPEVTPAPSPFYLRTQTQAYAAWQAASGGDAELLESIALTPQALWIGDWLSATEVTQVVAGYISAAQLDSTIPVLVLYAIPGRDCGSHSAGGLTAPEYQIWLDAVAEGITGEPWVIVEPDALPQVGMCAGQGDRIGMLRDAAAVMAEAGARVYLDVGHSDWLSPTQAIRALSRVGFEDAVGFALNTSNFGSTADERVYGEEIAKGLGEDVGFIIDVSRNANGSNGEWCNPAGRGLGVTPRLVTDNTALEALLWVKAPGESDGTCNGGPAAGEWWQEGAIELARNRR